MPRPPERIWRGDDEWKKLDEIMKGFNPRKKPQDPRAQLWFAIKGGKGVH